MITSHLKYSTMKIQTYSIVAGSRACNAKCPFCASRMTPPHGLKLKEPEVNWRNFRKGAQYARDHSASTVMITGDGEPTIFPEQIDKFMIELERFNFPFIELQTNGILFQQKKERYNEHLKLWYEKGMTTISLSIVGYDPEKNRQIYLPDKESYINLPELIRRLHDLKFTVRLATVLLDGFIDDVGELEKLIEFARENKVKQLSITPVNKPAQDTWDSEVFKWTERQHLKPKQEQVVLDYLKNKGTHLRTLLQGTLIYDVDGQNVTLKRCFTRDPNTDDIRHLIFFPNGDLRFDWQYNGAVIL